MSLQEPRRSRVFVIAGVALAVVGTALRVADHRLHSRLLFSLTLAWFLLILAIGTTLVVAGIKRVIGSEKRPARFAVSGKAFWASAVFPPGLIVLLLLMLAANNYANTINRWDDEDRTFAIFAMVSDVLMTAVLAVLIAFAWRATALQLTPAGITAYTPLLRRTIPWDALAQGGPLRPLTTASRLQLITARPELVEQRGWALASGTRQMPAITLQLNVHPWFVADAIRWYAEHPEHRQAIGQPAEHDRLLAALRG